MYQLLGDESVDVVYRKESNGQKSKEWRKLEKKYKE